MKTIIFALVLLSLAAVLAGCGGDEGAFRSTGSGNKGIRVLGSE